MKPPKAEFLTSARDLASCPPSRRPEVAFIGRSNVGKSSLVNLLTQQRALAKVSKVPGKTKLINFFSIDDRWTLVDLPGYGFAKTAKGEEQRFNLAAGDYLVERPNLKLVLVLVDARFEPMEIDLAFLHWLNQTPRPYALLFTKTDLLPQSSWQRHREIYRETLDALELPVPDIIPCSAVQRAGRGEILQRIEKVLPKRPKRGQKSGVSLKWMQ